MTESWVGDGLREQARERVRAEANQRRKALGLRYRDIADKSGTSLTLVTRLLRGPGWPRPGHVEAISDALGLGPSGLADLENAILKDVVAESIASERGEGVAVDGHLAVDLDPSSVEGFTPSEIQEVILGAKKGAVAAINEIHSRRRPFRGVAA